MNFLHLDIVIPVVLGILAGGVAVLKIIAPRTKTDADDAVLRRLEQLEALVGMIPVPAPSPAPVAPSKDTVKSDGTVVRDHRA